MVIGSGLAWKSWAKRRSLSRSAVSACTRSVMSISAVRMHARPSTTMTSALVMATISRPLFARKRASTLRIERPARSSASPASRWLGSTQTAISGTDRPMTSSRE